MNLEFSGSPFSKRTEGKMARKTYRDFSVSAGKRPEFKTQLNVCTGTRRLDDTILQTVLFNRNKSIARTRIETIHSPARAHKAHNLP